MTVPDALLVAAQAAYDSHPDSSAPCQPGALRAALEAVHGVAYVDGVDFGFSAAASVHAAWVAQGGSESVGARLDAVLAELASIVTAEYASDAPRERVAQRIASAASTLAACRQESDVWEIYPDRLAGVRDAIRAGKEGR